MKTCAFVALAAVAAALPAPFHGIHGLPFKVDTAPEFEHMNYHKVDNKRGPFGKLYPTTFNTQSTRTGFDHSIVSPLKGLLLK